MATLDSLARIARPVFFEVDSEDYPYAGRGTVLLARLRSTIYVVGLEHVIKGPVENIRIYPNDESDVSIPLDWVHAVASPAPSDEDFAQLKLLRVDSKNLEGSPGSSLSSLDIECAKRTWRPPLAGEDVLVYGYPDKTRDVAYEDCRLRYQQAEMTGRYVGPSLSSSCSEFNLEPPPGIDDLSGFSGSPVFGITRVGNRLDTRFRGVMIRGGADSKKGHFVNAEVVFGIFDRIRPEGDSA